MAAHLVDIADLRAKHAKASVDEAKAVHTQHQAIGQIADTHQTMITNNRLAQTHPSRSRQRLGSAT